MCVCVHELQLTHCMCCCNIAPLPNNFCRLHHTQRSLEGSLDTKEAQAVNKQPVEYDFGLETMRNESSEHPACRVSMCSKQSFCYCLSYTVFTSTHRDLCIEEKNNIYVRTWPSYTDCHYQSVAEL